MKKPLLFIAMALFTGGSYAQSVSTPASAILSPITKQYLSESKSLEQGKTLPNYVYKKRNDGVICLSALIKIDAGFSEDQLAPLGVSIGTKAGNIWTALIPTTSLEAFTRLKGIAGIELDEPVMPALDQARIKTKADSVHQGFNLPMPYTGKGVVMGIIDFGFDYNHPVMYDTLGTTYRIKRVWELNTTGTPPSGYTYGHEITDTNSIKAQGTDNPVQTHGTAVAGIAAGSGFGSPTAGLYRGFAYESEMVMVGVRRDSIETQWLTGGFSDFIDGVNYIFNYATSVGKPAVINISWGSQSGPHDGSSLFNQACDNLSGPGKIIVMSAGNEGSENIHIKKTFTATDTVVHTFLDFSSNTYKRTWVDVWGEQGKTFCSKVTLYNNGVAGNAISGCVAGTSNSYYLLASNGLDTCFVTFYPYTSSYNNKPRLTVSVFNKTADDVSVSVSGNDGTVDMWDEYYYYGYKYQFSSEFVNLGKSWATAGANTSTVSDMGSAQSVLLIGAYNSKNAWTDINNVARVTSGGINTLAYFSSRGPMIDGRIKPDITAPGMMLATGVSSFDTAYTETGSRSAYVVNSYQFNGKKYYFSMFNGTSASSPVAAGIVALMLQVMPTLTPAMVNDIVSSTAINDLYTNNVVNNPSNLWGHGKINAYAAIKRTIEKLGVREIENKLNCALFPNPNDGSFMLTYKGSLSEVLAVRMINISGQVVYNTAWNVTKGANSQTINIAGLAPGTYFVQVQGKAGRSLIKMVIQ